MREHFEFDRVELLTAGARGVPGRRTFFLLAGRENDVIRVWIEKGQLEALGEAIDQLIDQLPARARPGSVDPAQEASEEPDLRPTEFRARSLALGYDRDRRLATLLINEHLDDNEVDAPAAQAWVTLAQLKALSQRIATVCASGRQPCPLCGLPLDPDGHVCPRTNGHHPALRLS